MENYYSNLGRTGCYTTNGWKQQRGKLWSERNAIIERQILNRMWNVKGREKSRMTFGSNEWGTSMSRETRWCGLEKEARAEAELWSCELQLLRSTRR